MAVYLRPAADGGAGEGAALAALQAALASQAGYVAESLGVPILPGSQLSPGARVLAAEVQAVPVGEGESQQRAEFELVLAAPDSGSGGAEAAARALSAARIS